jgi:hypothetical protein
MSGGLKTPSPKFSARRRYNSVEKHYYYVILGAALALVLNKTIAGFVNTVLSPLGLTYV